VNAIPPKNQLSGDQPGKEAREAVRLTMDFEDGLDEEAPAPQPEAQGWADAEPDDRAQPPPAPPGDAFAEPAPKADAARPARAAHGAEPRAAGPALPAQLAAIELVLTVEVGSLSIPLKDLLAVEPGQLIGLDSMASEPVSVLVNGKPFARGEIVAIGERFGVRLLDIVAPAGGGG
jgi:flagellar motor switch protein FliN/FliY